MESFDWIALLDSAGVEYADHGPNVSRGHVVVRCPLCVDDPSKHFGIRLSDGAWGCWRNPEHRGRSRRFLIQILLRCSRDEAERVLRDGTPVQAVDLDGLLDELYRGERLGGDEPRPLSWPEEFRATPRGSWGGRVLTYLEDRGFDQPEEVFRYFGMRYATTGDFKGRVILPIEVDGELLGWTGRAIVPSRIRYRSFPYGEGLRSLVFNFDRAMARPVDDCTALFLVEGPFDVLPLHWFGAPWGGSAAGLLGLSVNPRKLDLIARLVDHYPKTLLLLDAEAVAEELEMVSHLTHLGVEMGELPQGVGDPGDLTPHQVAGVIRRAW